MANAVEHEQVGHIVSLRLLFGVLGILLALTFVTVAITWFDLGNFNLIAALAIAVIKASLVLLYFMHLRWDRPFNSVVIIISFALVMLFIVFTLLDSYQYEPDMIPGYAPRLQQ